MIAAGLRVFAPSGVVEDRVMAAVTLARLRNEIAGDVLAGVLTDQECFLEALLQIGGVADSFGEHEELLTSWLLGLLDSADEVLRRCALIACGALGVAAAGPRLLWLAHTAAEGEWTRGEHSWDQLRFLTEAARAWPSQEVAEEVQRWLNLRTEPDTDISAIHYQPGEAAPRCGPWAEPGPANGRSSGAPRQ